ncbi:unnamed protein product [Schistosoma turkestanicum]|nr:unnamed protein product [Schistosoma turkestanicum]
MFLNKFGYVIVVIIIILEIIHCNVTLLEKNTSSAVNSPLNSSFNYSLFKTKRNSNKAHRYFRNSFNRFLNSFLQTQHHYQSAQSELFLHDFKLTGDSVEFKQIEPLNVVDNNDEELMHGNHIHEINYFKDNPRYENKTVCKSHYTWKDISLSWKILMKNFNPNCTHILGNLIISGLDEDDDVSLLENIEEISGYLVIYGVGRKELRLPRLKLIKGHEWIMFKSRKVALLVVSNYKQIIIEQNDLQQQQQPSSSSNLSSQSNNETGKQQFGLKHLQSLEMTSFISVVQHGIYFYDNPGLCYTPFTLKWDEMVESAELQTIDLYALHSTENIHLWYEYCQCKYLNQCAVNRTNNKTTTEHSIFNLSNVVQSKQIFNELLLLRNNANDDGIEVRNFQKRDIFNSTTNHPSVLNSTNELSDDNLNKTNIPFNIHQSDHSTSANQTIDNVTNLSYSNQVSNENIQPEQLPVDNEYLLEFNNIDQDENVMPKIGTQINEISLDENNLATEQSSSHETIVTPTQTPNENVTSTKVLDETELSTVNNDSDVGTTNVIETETTEYNISAWNTYSTTDILPQENTTTTTSNVQIDDEEMKKKKMDLPKIDDKPAVNYRTMEHPTLPCHTSCPSIQGKRYCWGPRRDQCQTVHKCQIRLCEGSNWCFRSTPSEYHHHPSKNSTYHQYQASMNDFVTSRSTSKEQCCHSECAAGCDGPRARDCNACLRLSNAGRCTDSCPASKKYNKSTFSWMENPDGLLTFGMICVKTCPKTYLRDGDHCVSKCARPGYIAYQGECIPCANSICPKICTLKEIETIKGIDYLHRKSLHAMENCTVFEGDIKLSMQSFIGDPFYNLTQTDEGVQWNDLMIGLSKLEYITGTLYISAGSHAPWLTNLTFLSNVKIIGGISPNIQQTRTININLNYHLEFLGMTSLQKLGYPSLLITGNPRLCYVDTVNWAQLLLLSEDTNNEHLSTTNEEINDESQTKPLNILNTIQYYNNNDLLMAQILANFQNDLKRKQSLKESVGSSSSSIFINGNAHFEFCKGRGAVCDNLCQPYHGCWGPGREFCLQCKYWSAEETIPHGKRICVEHCEDLPGFYTPKFNDTSLHHLKQQQHQQQLFNNDELNLAGDLKNVSTILLQNNNNNDKTNQLNEFAMAENKLIENNPSSMFQCKKCSEMCSLQNKTCSGPNDDQCIGSCRYVQDGPFCRATCPPNKYTDPITKKCLECASGCTPPNDLIEENFYHQVNNVIFNQKPSNQLHHYCTGSGDWPGIGGCNFCKQTVLYLEPKNANYHLKCVNTCPFGTYQHVINLHHRGGSSVDRQLSNYSSFQQIATTTTTFTWSHTDANHFHKFPPNITQQIAQWLFNYTQSKFYGLAQICLPCNEQCDLVNFPFHQQSTVMMKSSTAAMVACYGPSPEQCVRCAYASYQGRCVGACPTGTYPKKKLLRNLDTNVLNYHFHGYSNDNITSMKCLPCHDECELGCIGPTAHDCTRCRHVKIYSNSQMKSWLCNTTCPEFSPFAISDQKTGEMICSTDLFNLHIAPYESHSKNLIKIALNSSIVNNINNDIDNLSTTTIAGDQLNFMQNFQMIHYFWYNHQYYYLSTEAVGLISALLALGIMLTMLSLIIYWTIRTRSKYVRIEQEDDNMANHNANRSICGKINKLCEYFWTQGQPQVIMKKKSKHSPNNNNKKKNSSSMKARLLHWNSNNNNNNSNNESSILMNSNLITDRNHKLIDSIDKEVSLTHSESCKPNMATLRIITESELIRGPLIGSGAFGTVYCGVWCPKFIQPKSDSIHHDTHTTTITTTNSNNNNHNNNSQINTRTNSIVTSNSNGFNKRANETEMMNSIHWNNDQNDCLNLHIPVAIKVLSDSADPQTNKELLEEAKLTHSESCKPNMATLRIITESELIRGPLIGSGAFGTVYCGVWCPKFIQPKSDSIHHDTHTTTITTTNSNNNNHNNNNQINTRTNSIVTSNSNGFNKRANETEMMNSIHWNNDQNDCLNLHIPVAIKVLSDSADPQTNKELLEEAKVMATVDHPCCVRFLALCLTSKLQLITEFLPLGSLLEFVKIRWDLIEVTSLFQWSEQIASGMTYLSARGIIHRDLAARNVLVQSKDQVQITDFGLAKCLDTTSSEYHASGGRMPIKWLAIESIQDRIFSSKSDVWAYGITLWEMCTFGHRPYENIHAKDLLDFLEKGNRLPQPETTSLDFYCLMLQCWHEDPNLRPTFKEISVTISEMKTTPNRYLFIMPELRSYKFTQQITSNNALEFLTTCLTDSTLPLTSTQTNLSSIQSNHQIYDNNNNHNNNNHSLLLPEQSQSDLTDYTHYTQINYNWLKNLYVNSKTNVFPDCVKTLLDNYNYLIGINGHNDNNNSNNNNNDNYIRFQNDVNQFPTSTNTTTSTTPTTTTSNQSTDQPINNYNNIIRINCIDNVVNNSEKHSINSIINKNLSAIAALQINETQLSNQYDEMKWNDDEEGRSSHD